MGGLPSSSSASPSSSPHTIVHQHRRVSPSSSARRHSVGGGVASARQSPSDKTPIFFREHGVTAGDGETRGGKGGRAGSASSTAHAHGREGVYRTQSGDNAGDAAAAAPGLDVATAGGAGAGGTGNGVGGAEGAGRKESNAAGTNSSKKHKLGLSLNLGAISNTNSSTNTHLLTKEELDRIVDEKVEIIFGHGDMNNDGVISHAEFLWAMTGLDFHMLDSAPATGLSARESFYYSAREQQQVQQQQQKQQQAWDMLGLGLGCDSVDFDDNMEEMENMEFSTRSSCDSPKVSKQASKQASKTCRGFSYCDLVRSKPHRSYT